MTNPPVNLFDGSHDPTASRTSSSLLQRARALDQEAWERIVQLYSPLVYHWCRQKGLQEADALDMGQDVFQAVAAGLSRFEHAPIRGSFRRWLRTITRNKIVDFIRARPKEGGARGGSDAWEQLSMVAADDAVPEADSLSQETQLLYERALQLIRSEFNETYWQAFQKTAVHQQSAAEAAHELGVSCYVVYNARSRIMRRLREEFADLLDGGEEEAV